MRSLSIVWIALLAWIAAWGCAADTYAASEVVTFMKDGGWCWYQDPRAIIAGGKLLVGGIDGRNGDVKVSVYDLKQEKDLGTVTLNAGFQADDHDAPALYVRPDGRVLAVYTKHATDRIHR